MKLRHAVAISFASLLFAACGGGTGEPGGKTPADPVCGNGIVESGEACDDGNSNDGDGCLSDCTVATCGDGVVHVGVEECDDGNDVDTDGCLSTCVAATCGDGIVQAGVEECDDGNQDDTDACLSSCVAATCGDGIVQTGVEGCDDGNDDETDGCLSNCVSATCGDGIIQADVEMCDDGDANSDTGACTTACVPARCGDGNVHEGVELCDDGNADDTDACPSTCVPAECGDGFVQEGVEQCDDGNEDDSDGCLTSCVIATCGDGVVHAGVEACDDGDANDDNGSCTTTCRVATCGDGLVHTDVEACDDGSLNSDLGACLTSCQVASCGDGFVHVGVEPCDLGEDNSETGACLPGCVPASCGDGFVRAGVEECDEGAGNSNTGTCTTSCKTPACGDGFVQAGETCDLGASNSDAPDGTCRSDCTPARCGDGIVDTGEICDDGNLVDNDTCSNLCTLNGDNCASRAVLTTDAFSPGFTVQGDTTAFSSNYQLGCQVSGFNNDVVYSFTAPVAGKWTFSVVGSFETGIAIQTVCGDTSSNLGCSLNFGPSVADVVTVDLDANDEITILVDGYGDFSLNQGTFTLTGSVLTYVDVGDPCDHSGATTICVEGSQCDPNSLLCRASVCGDGVVESGEACDDGNFVDNDGCSNLCTLNGATCATAAVITPDAAGGFTVASSTAGMGSDYTLGCATSSGPPDTVFSYTAPFDGRFSFTMDSAFDSVLAVQSTCGDTTLNLACEDLIGTTANEIAEVELTSGTTVYILADGWGSGATSTNFGPFTLVGTAIPFVPVGGPCDPVGNTTICTFGSQCDTTTLVCRASVCGDGVIESGEECDDGNLDDTDDCSNLCLINGNTCGTAISVTSTAATPGFTFSGTTVGKSASYASTCATSTGPSDAFYEFTAPVSGNWKFALTASFDMVVSVLSSCGASASVLDCKDTAGTSETVFADMQAGESVVLVVDGYGSSTTTNRGTFTVTGSVIPFVPVGAACDPAGLTSRCDVGGQCDPTTLVCYASVCGNGIQESGEECDGGTNCDASCMLVPIPLGAAGVTVDIQGSLATTDPTWTPTYMDCTNAGRPGSWYYDRYLITNDSTVPKTIDLVGTDFGDYAYLFLYNPPFDASQPRVGCNPAGWAHAPTLSNTVLQPGQSKVLVVSSGADGVIGNYTISMTTRPICGDGVWSPGEQCEDGGTVAGDGCSPTCTLESGFSCTEALGCFANVCGDGIRGNGEACDDGNTIETDLCTSTCQLTGTDCTAPAVFATTAAEPGFTVSGNTNGMGSNFTAACSTSSAPEDMVYEFTPPIDGKWRFSLSTGIDFVLTLQTTCGDNATNLACSDQFASAGSEWVEASLTAGQPVFIVVDGYGTSATGNRGAFTLTGTVIPFVPLGSDCDLAGVTNLCELGTTCSAVTETCINTVCGNALVEPTGGEECDDGNVANGDGCNEFCQVEATPLAGPGMNLVMHGSLDATDPSWAPPFSGCTTATRTGTWHYDAYPVRNDGTTVKTIDIRAPMPVTSYMFVYDGPWDPAEQVTNCLRGSNTAALSILNLAVQPGAMKWIIVSSGNSSTPAHGAYTLTVSTRTICGDGIWSPGEQCEDGNTTAGDGCSATCTFEIGYTCTETLGCFANVCGDGIAGNGEPCDDGNAIETDLCTSSCQLNGRDCMAPAIFTTTAADPGFAIAANTTGMGTNFPAACSTLSAPADMVFEFTPPVAGRWRFALSTGSDFVLSMQTTCGDNTTYLACSDRGGSTTSEWVEADLPAGQPVFIVVDGYGPSATSNSGPFTLTGTVMPFLALGDPCDPAGVANLCDGGTVCNTTTEVCSLPVCGNGQLESVGSEQCDDGNTTPGDGCDSFCQIEPIALASVGTDLVLTGSLDSTDLRWGPPLSGCTSTTRTGTWHYDAYLVENTSLTDKTIDVRTSAFPTSAYMFVYDAGWDPTQQIAGCLMGSNTTSLSILNLVVPAGESRWIIVSSGNNTTPAQGAYTLTVHTQSICGDGVWSADEQCEDGNVMDSDGCSSTCTFEAGFTCTPAGGCFANICGDGIAGNGEACDDGNTVDDDECDNLCQITGNECNSAIAVTSTAATPELTFSGTTVGRSASYSSTCATSTGPSDAFYKFTAPVSGLWTFVVTSTHTSSFDTVVSLVSACGAGGAVLDCKDTSTGAETVSTNLQAGESVILVVDGYGTSTTSNRGTFTVTGSVIPSVGLGQTCDLAGEVTVCERMARCDDTTLTCVATVCGNGIVEPTGGEICDDGDTDDWNGCTNDCQIRGDDCSAPFDLRISDTNAAPDEVTITGSLATFQHNRHPSCNGSQPATSAYRDVVYSLTGNGTTEEYWTLTLASATSTALVLDIAAACDIPNTRLACVIDATTSAPKTVSFALGANETVYVWVDTQSSTTGPAYTLTGTVQQTVPVGGTCDPLGVLDRCVESAGCDAAGICQASVCGDGVVSGLEECDDNNTVDHDGCSSTCHREGDTCNAPYDLNALNAMSTTGPWVHGGVAADWGPMTANYVPTCSFAAGRPDVVYSFTAPQAGNYRFAETGALDAVLYASNACPNQGPGLDLYCADSPENFTRALVAGETIFIFVDPYGSVQTPSTSAWNMEVTLVP